MKQKIYWGLAILIIMLCIGTYYDQRIQLQEKQRTIDRVESDLYNYALQPKVLQEALQITANEPSEENFANLAPLWRSNHYNIRALIRLHKEDIDPEIYQEYETYRHNQVFAMLSTYAKPEYKSFEPEKEKDLKRILTAWKTFSGYVEKFGGTFEIENPNEFTQEYTRFLKEAQIDWLLKERK